jgi:hypothetical protein
MTPDEFTAKWANEAEVMQRRGVIVNGTRLLAEVLADFQEVMSAQSDALLTLEEAALRSGYSVEHLGRLLRVGRVPNAGRKGAPRVKLGDLPRKPASLVAKGPRAYDPGADARTLLSRQRGGSNDQVDQAGRLASCRW